MALVYLGIAVLAYLIGAIPIGVIIANFRGVDIRRHGSGKTGTTNVLRTIGRRAAALVLLGDFVKGALAVWAARLIAEGFATPGERVPWLDDAVSVITLAAVIAAAASISGHVWSIYMRLLTGAWAGGRGVATALGAIAVVNPLVLVAALGVGIPTMLISRYVSLGSIMGSVASGLAIILLVLTGSMPAVSLLFILLVFFVIVAHRDNIERILKGTERKLGERAKV